MAVAKMKLVNIVGQLKDFDSVVQKCCIHGDFHPEQFSSTLGDVEGFHSIDAPNPYERALQKAVDIGIHSNIKLHYSDFKQLDLANDELENYVMKAGDTIDSLNEKIQTFEQSIGKYQQSIKQLQHLKKMDAKLDDILGCQFVTFRFGKLPQASLPKISAGNGRLDFIFVPLEESDLFHWGFYAARNVQLAAIDDFFNSLFFEIIPIIEEARGTPTEATENISKDLVKVQGQLSDVQKEVDQYWSANQATFMQVYSRLRYLHDSFDLRKYASEYDNTFYIFGWVPQKQISVFTQRFVEFPTVDCVVEGIEEAPGIEPPTHLVNNKLAKPYEDYLKLYGMPHYNEIDPTPILTVVYSITFGIMFGDLGQGFIILLAALFMKFKKKMFLGDILIRCSVFCMFFGFCYNAFFGFEGERAILPFNFINGHSILPVGDANNLMAVLMISVVGGACLIIFCMFLNIANGIKQKNIEKILFSQNGLAGLVFYGAVIAAIALLLLKGINIFSPLYIIFLVVLPLLIIACKEPLARLFKGEKDWAPTNIGEFIMLAFFELFDILLSFVSNTISYIRIGAFILAHAAMMSAVFIIAQIFTGDAYNPIVLIVGNIFVIGLEGLIVGIQALRLEFYEMFSRFYEGGGKAFNPVSIEYDKN